MSSRTSLQRPPPPPSQEPDYSMPPPTSAFQPSPMPSVNGGERPVLTHQQITDKYSNLKRRYFQLDDRLKDTQAEHQKSMERNTKLRSERNILLDRIIELEERNKLLERRIEQIDPGWLSAHNESPASATGAFPRALVTQKAQAAFVSNLQRAMAEVENEDPSVDPVLYSRHIGPTARKREAEEIERRQDEEARELKRQRRPRAAAGSGPPPGSAPPILATRAGSGNGNSLSATDAAQLQPVQFQWRASGSGTPVLAVERNKPIAVRDEPGSPRFAVMGSGASASSSIPPSVPPVPQREYSDREEATSRPPSESPVSPGPYYHSGSRFVESDTREMSAPPSRPLMYVTPVPPNAPTSISPPLRAPPRQSMPPPLDPRLSLPPPPSLTTTTSNHTISAPRPTELQRLTKPKRLKAHTVTSKSHSIPTVPRDRATGRPLLPLNVGIMTVLSLGEICMREHFHTERYIFPIGYEVTRRYLSAQDPNAEVVYHCTILDGGDGPKFQIIAADMPDKPIIAGTATGAWSGIVRAANLIRKRQHSNSVSGPDYFGLGQNTIKHLIQELPGADRLKNYVWQNFVEGGPLGGRHAAVIPALPEEYENSMAVGAYYNRDRERALPLPPGEASAGLGLSVMPEPRTPHPAEEYADYEREHDLRYRGRTGEQEIDYRCSSRRDRSASISSNSTISTARRAPSAQRQRLPLSRAPSPPPSSAASSQTTMSQSSMNSSHSQAHQQEAQSHTHVDSRRTRSQSRSQHRQQQKQPAATSPRRSSSNVPPKLASIMHAYAPPNAPLTSHSRAATAVVPRSSYSPEGAIVRA